MRKEITFSGSFLSVNDKEVDIQDFREKLNETRYTSTEESKLSIYEVRYSEDYLLMTCGHGSAKPYNPEVVNIDTKEKELNPKKANQVEPRESFGLIDFKSGLLWLSNSKKKNDIVRFLQVHLQTPNIIAKDVYDEHMFITTLKKLDSIQISAQPDLFNNSGILKKELVKEIHGYEASVATLNFKYYQRPLNDNLIHRVKNLLKTRQSIGGIVISGRDEQNLGMMFNSEGFSRKISFKTLVDDDEMYIVDEVFSLLTAKIKNEEN